MIVMDMDGTLLTSDNTISPKTKEMLLQVQKQGVRLVLASGRSYCKLLEYAKELQMDTYGGYLLEVNGLILYDLSTGERHIRKQMGRREMEEIFTYFQQWDVETGECAGKKGFEGFLLARAHYTKMAGADASGHYKGQRTSGSYRAAAYPDGKCNGIWGRGK